MNFRAPLIQVPQHPAPSPNCPIQISVKCASPSTSIHEEHKVLLSNLPNSNEKGKLVMNMDTPLLDFYNNVFLHGEPEIEHDMLRFPGGLTLEFYRTLRAPNDGQVHPLPCNLGLFPIKRVNKNHFQIAMARSEAMWIGFGKDSESAVQVFVEKRNAITGKAKGDLEGGAAQNYCPVPSQPWLDGFLTDSGSVSQFVATEPGIEIAVHPLIQTDVVFDEWIEYDYSKEIFSSPRELGRWAGDTITMGPLPGRTLTINCDPSDTVEKIKKHVYDKEGTPPDQQWLFFGGKQLEDGQSLLDCGIRPESVLKLVPKLYGGGRGGGDGGFRMSYEAGQIKHEIEPDMRDVEDYVSLEHAMRVRIDLVLA